MSLLKLSFMALIVALVFASTSSAQLFQRANRCCQRSPVNRCCQPANCCRAPMMMRSLVSRNCCGSMQMVQPMMQTQPMSSCCGGTGMMSSGITTSGQPQVATDPVTGERRITPLGRVYNENCQKTYEACTKACDLECGGSSECYDYCACNREKCDTQNPNVCSDGPPSCLTTAQPDPISNPPIGQ